MPLRRTRREAGHARAARQPGRRRRRPSHRGARPRAAGARDDGPTAGRLARQAWRDLRRHRGRGGRSGSPHRRSGAAWRPCRGRARSRVPASTTGCTRPSRTASAPDHPVMFAKFNTAVIGHGAEIRWSPGLTQAVDFEAELAVVIGRSCRRVSVGRCARLRRRVHVPERRQRARPAVQRQAVHARQVARHVLRRWDRGWSRPDEIADPQDLRHPLPRQRRGDAGREHVGHGLWRGGARRRSARRRSPSSRATSSPRARPAASAGSASRSGCSRTATRSSSRSSVWAGSSTAASKSGRDRSRVTDAARCR